MAESVTRFLGEDASLGSTISNLEGRLDGFGQSVDGVGEQTGMLPAAFSKAAIAVAAFVASVAGAAVGIKTFTTALDFIEKLDNLEAATGASGEALIKLQRAFDLTGSSADKVGPALNKVQEMIAKAADGSPKAVEKLGLLGISLDELRNLSPDKQLEAVMKAIDGLPTPAEKARAAMAIFGTTLGRELMPLITDFDVEMAKALETLGSFPRIVETYGPAMSRFGDAIDALKKKPEEFSVGVVGPMSAILGNLATQFAKFDASGLGEAIGIQLNKTLREMLIWAENVYLLLGSIWNGLGDMAIGPVLTDALGSFGRFVEAAKARVSEIYLSLRDADFTQLGNNIATAIKGSLADPAQFFEAWWDYMNLKGQEFGNFLGSVVETSLRTNQLTVEAFVESGFVEKMSDLIYNGLVATGTKGFEKWAELMKFPVDVLDGLMQAMFLQNGNKLQETLTTAFKGSLKEFAEALNPMGWVGNLFNRVAGDFGSSLGSNINKSVVTFGEGWSATAGPLVDKFWGGWRAEGDRASKEFGAGLAPAAQSLIDAGNIIGERAEFTRIKLFDTKAASEEAAASFAKLAESAETVPQQAKLFADNINTAKLDVTAPGGISPALDANANALNDTANKTQSASGTIVTAFDGVAKSGQNFTSTTDKAGQSFNSQVAAAGKSFAADVKSAMGGLTDAVRGFATESTLRSVIEELRAIKDKVGNPVLVN
jgi:hypothetical protein